MFKMDPVAHLADSRDVRAIRFAAGLHAARLIQRMREAQAPR
jgi:hypothetical protein